jgi:DNA-binding transcriptional regulator YdaS (Cro superfamily)
MQNKLNKKRQAVTKKILFAPMDATEIIDCLGGTFAVAKICQISPPAVSQWRNNGIPQDKMIFLAASLEKASDGKYTRKQMFPSTWQDIWVELK